MFSKLAARASQVQMTAQATKAFRTTTVAGASKKPSIGDAVTILQSKVSQINQVVSYPKTLYLSMLIKWSFYHT